MAWIYLTVAGLFEIGWAIGLKYTDGFTRLLPSMWTLDSMILSIVLLGLALRTLLVRSDSPTRSTTSRPSSSAARCRSGPPTRYGQGSVRSGPPRLASICSRSRQPWRACCASD